MFWQVLGIRDTYQNMAVVYLVRESFLISKIKTLHEPNQGLRIKIFVTNAIKVNANSIRNVTV